MNYHSVKINKVHLLFIKSTSHIDKKNNLSYLCRGLFVYLKVPKSKKKGKYQRNITKYLVNLLFNECIKTQDRMIVLYFALGIYVNRSISNNIVLSQLNVLMWKDTTLKKIKLAARKTNKIKKDMTSKLRGSLLDEGRGGRIK